MVQLRRLPELLARRRQVVESYDRELEGVAGLRLPPALLSGHDSSYFFSWVQLAAQIRDAAANDLYRAGVYTSFKYAPLHRVPAYWWQGSLPGAERAEAQTLCRPLHPGMDEIAIKTVVRELRQAIDSRSGNGGWWPARCTTARPAIPEARGSWRWDVADVRPNHGAPITGTKLDHTVESTTMPVGGSRRDLPADP